MILFYIDESGTNWTNTDTKFFILGGLAISGDNLAQMELDFCSLKKTLKSNIEPDKWELKGRDIWQGDGAFRKVKPAQRLEAYVKISQAISQLPCHIFALKVNKKYLRESGADIKDDTDLYRFAFKHLLDYLDNFLKDKNETGILFVDSRSTLLSSVQDDRLCEAYRNWACSRQKPSNFVQVPWGGRSDFYAGLQLADCPAYLIFKNYEEEEKSATTGCQELQDAFHLLKQQINLFEIPKQKIKFEDRSTE